MLVIEALDALLQTRLFQPRQGAYKALKTDYKLWLEISSFYDSGVVIYEPATYD